MPFFTKCLFFIEKRYCFNKKIKLNQKKSGSQEPEVCIIKIVCVIRMRLILHRHPPWRKDFF